MEAFQLEHRYCLSRHVRIRPCRQGLRVESPWSGKSFLLTSPSVFRFLTVLANPVRVNDLLHEVGDSQRAGVLRFLQQCYDCEFLTRVDEQGRREEEQDSRAHWEFHDLLFHTHSRLGRNTAPVGATYRFRGILVPEPAVKRRSVEEIIPLSSADVPRLKEADLPFTRVLEERRSVRSTEPVEIDALGEFLFRSCRVTALSQKKGEEELVRSVYPSGGSLHPLEIYVVSAACRGLERGVYQYDRVEHILYPVAGFTSDVKAILEDAKRGAGGLAGYPPLLLVITARFRRTMWKYQSIAYHLILQEVGGLYQTMYLVATAMGLSPCALGVGDSDRFAKIASLGYYEESSVGEFILGGARGSTGEEPVSGNADSVARNGYGDA